MVDNGDVIYDDYNDPSNNKKKGKNPGGNPAWTKGGPSPNPAGRPKADIGLIEYAKQKVGNSGEKMIDFLIEVLNNDSSKVKGNYKPYSTDQQHKAAVELLDRVFGKSRQAVDFSAHIDYQLNVLQAIKIIDERRGRIIDIKKGQIQSDKELKLIDSQKG